jgi:hypothetical protein
MSLTYTAELNGADPFDSLAQLQRHATEITANPASWMPWNYRDTLAASAAERIRPAERRRGPGAPGAPTPGGEISGYARLPKGHQESIILCRSDPDCGLQGA